ncbi:MAG: 6,7-dimethyl-8-ribityllumazine synthase [Kiritimatiellae bacterium]|nr:6,7-dimethyl-8-ribityllumazine synthase [Kiritimatiellia bacterium]
MKKEINMETALNVPSFEGIQQITGSFDGENVKCALVASRFNIELTSKLARYAVQALIEHGVKEADITLIWVPGAYEIPTIAGELAKNGHYDAILALGVVVQGETQHAQLINEHIALALGRMSIEYALPVIYEVISAASLAQAEERCTGEKKSRGWYAALAALEMVKVFQSIRK